jgi:NAD(P)-dependent dehydrogenase (short-subunit alcohol dehydrogenase family)
MHPFASGCALAGVLLFANAVQAAPQHDHETAPAHDHASQATDQAPAAAQRWQPDAALRKGMGVVHAAHAVLPGMLERRQGRIVAIASTAGLKGYAYVSAYSAAKHAVIGLTAAIKHAAPVIMPCIDCGQPTFACECIARWENEGGAR